MPTQTSSLRPRRYTWPSESVGTCHRNSPSKFGASVRGIGQNCDPIRSCLMELVFEVVIILVDLPHWVCIHRMCGLIVKSFFPTNEHLSWTNSSYSSPSFSAFFAGRELNRGWLAIICSLSSVLLVRVMRS